MPLLELELPLGVQPLPGHVRSFLRTADLRIEQFLQECRVPAFVPSDYVGAYQLLDALLASDHPRGDRFCEWGSGFGVVACLAATLGYDAYGIEMENELVEAARELANDYELAAEFVAGSFVPRGGEKHVYSGGGYAWLTTDSDYAYEELGLELTDMDVVYAYPWPDEENMTAVLFEKYAGNGAILLTYHGVEGFRVRRKVSRRAAKR